MERRGRKISRGFFAPVSCGSVFLCWAPSYHRSMLQSDTDGVTELIVEFLLEIGIAVSAGEVDDASFLPGIEVVNGSLVVDISKLKYPGDLLHEAGHLAVSPAAQRSRLSGTVEDTHSAPQLIEMEAMLWSYAAALHLGIDPRIVFHKDGYHGQSESLLRNFGLGVFLGVHGLEKDGMTLSAADAAHSGRRPFPVMQKWLRD